MMAQEPEDLGLRPGRTGPKLCPSSQDRLCGAGTSQAQLRPPWRALPTDRPTPLCRRLLVLRTSHVPAGDVAGV